MRDSLSFFLNHLSYFRIEKFLIEIHDMKRSTLIWDVARDSNIGDAAGAPKSASCLHCVSGEYSTAQGDSSIFCPHIHAGFYPRDIHEMISHWCCLTKRSEYVVTGASGSFTCIQCQAGTYSTGIGARFEISCTYTYILSTKLLLSFNETRSLASLCEETLGFSKVWVWSVACYR